MKKAAFLLAACAVFLVAFRSDWEATLAVVFGWMPFLMRVLPQVAVDWPSVLLGCASTILFTIGIHLMGRSWLRRCAVGQPPDARPPRWKVRWSLAIVAVAFLLFAAGISVVGAAHQMVWLLSAERLRGESMRFGSRTSTENLSYMGIAIHNYASAYAGTLPAGESTPDCGMLHSWETHLLPFMWYSRSEIDMNRAWNDPRNEKYFKVAIPPFINPDVRTPELLNADGFGLSHYAANIRIMGGNMRRKLEDLADTANTMLIGEVKAHFQPWGHPVNWRDPERGINRSGYGFGSPSGAPGAQFLMGDGSVRFMSDRTSPEVLRGLSNLRGQTGAKPGW